MLTSTFKRRIRLHLEHWRFARFRDVEYQPIVPGFDNILTSLINLDVQNHALKVPGSSLQSGNSHVARTDILTGKSNLECLHNYAERHFLCFEMPATTAELVSLAGSEVFEIVGALGFSNQVYCARVVFDDRPVGIVSAERRVDDKPLRHFHEKLDVFPLIQIGSEQVLGLGVILHEFMDRSV